MANLDSFNRVLMISDVECKDIAKCKEVGESMNYECILYSKRMQIRRFCYSCYSLTEVFDRGYKEKRQFFFNVLKNDKCWDTIGDAGAVKLNSKLAASMLVAEKDNPLSDFTRYQIACWFCLEEEIECIFNKFLLESKMMSGFTSEKLAKSLSGRIDESDLLLEYWSYSMIEGEKFDDMRREGLSWSGLERASAMPFPQLVAIEYFWDMMKSSTEMATDEKEVYMMRALSRLLRRNVYNAHGFDSHSDIISFIVNHMSLATCKKFFEDGYRFDGEIDIILVLIDECHFECAQKVLDSLQTEEFPSLPFQNWLDRFVFCKDCHLEEMLKLFARLFSVSSDRCRQKWVENLLNQLEYRVEALETVIASGHVQLLWNVLDRSVGGYMTNMTTYVQTKNAFLKKVNANPSLKELLQNKSPDSLIKLFNWKTEEY